MEELLPARLHSSPLGRRQEERIRPRARLVFAYVCVREREREREREYVCVVGWLVEFVCEKERLSD